MQTTLGLSNISFGLNPAARIVLNSVFLDECVKAGLDSAIVHASKILPIARIDEEQVKVALDLIYDRRAEGYDPLQKLLELFEGVDAQVDEGRQGRGAARAAAGRAAAAPHHRRREARAWRPTWTRRWQSVPRWRSSTTPCWTA